VGHHQAGGFTDTLSRFKAVLSHSVLQGMAGEAQQSCGFALIVVGLFKCLKNQAAFDLLQFDSRGRYGPGLVTGVGGTCRGCH